MEKVVTLKVKIFDDEKYCSGYSEPYQCKYLLHGICNIFTDSSGYSEPVLLDKSSKYEKCDQCKQAYGES